MTNKVSDAQLKAAKKYVKRGHFINVFFNESEMGLYEAIVRNAEFFGMKRTTYIKSILKGDFEKYDREKDSRNV